MNWCGILFNSLVFTVVMFAAQDVHAMCMGPGGNLKYVPTGAIGDKWILTGGENGPLGCPFSIMAPAPGGRGTFVNFTHGQVVDSSPNQGTAMTVAVYQQGADLAVDWGDTTPYNYDKFIVRWDKNGVNLGQRDVPNGFRTRGLWFMPLPSGGKYSIIVEGCDSGTLRSTCRQGWTVPATITYTPPPPPIVITDCRLTLPTGAIRDRWISMGGSNSPLGCPITQEVPISGHNGHLASFANGQIVWAPDQGNNMTVAAYQVESDAVVEWGPSDPFSYDKFNVLWNKDGQKITQNEIGAQLERESHLSWPEQPWH